MALSTPWNLTRHPEGVTWLSSSSPNASWLPVSCKSLASSVIASRRLFEGHIENVGVCIYDTDRSLAGASCESKDEGLPWSDTQLLKTMLVE
jgi:hypothetical protein